MRGTPNADKGQTEYSQAPTFALIYTNFIHTTANHPWLTADHGWTLAGTLHVGEPVQEADGDTAVVERVRVIPGAARATRL